MIGRTLLALAAAAGAVCAQPMNDNELLERGRSRVLETIERLPRYTCRQTVDRSEYHSSFPFSARATCDQILASRGDLSRLELVKTDRLRLEVEVTDEGVETFSWPGDTRMTSERIQDFAAQGLTGTGAFGPFLINIFGKTGVRFWPEGPARIEGMETRQYRYLVPLEVSDYRVGAPGDVTRTVPFEGRFWLDAATGELRRLMARTSELSRSTGNCEASTTVDFARVRIGAGDHLLAARSVLRAIRRDGAELENRTAYTACREFHGESAIHFGDAGAEFEAPTAAPPAGAPRATPAPALPPGARLTIRFASGIDSETSAAGDVLEARVTHTDARPRRRIVPESGAPARCRILTLENDRRAGRLSASIACEAIELEGRWRPFAVIADRPSGLLNEEVVKEGEVHGVRFRVTEGRWASGQGGVFSFPTASGRVATGPFAADWITVLPAKRAAAPIR